MEENHGDLVMLTQKHEIIEETPKNEDSFEDLYFLQENLIKETQTLVARCFKPEQADLINFDALQAICFLVITDQHIDLGEIELQNSIDLLGVHPMVLQDTVRILKKMYHIPKNADFLTFIRYIGPILLEKNALREPE